MVNKRKWHHWLVVLRHIKVWQLVLLLLLFGVLSAYLLRQNNLNMIQLRDAVKQADDNNGDTKTALLNLQRYVSAHMNTDLNGGVALQNAYQQAYNAAVQAALNATNPNSELYAQVEAECQPVYRSTHSFPAYTQCAHDKLSVLQPSGDPLSQVKAPPVELYKYDFATPLWTPDPAGFAVAITTLIGLVLLVRVIGYIILKLVLKVKKRNHFFK